MQENREKFGAKLVITGSDIKVVNAWQIIQILPQNLRSIFQS